MSRTPNYNFFKPGPADRVDPVADIADGMDLIDAAIAAEAATRAAAITALNGTYVALFDVTHYGAIGNGSTDDSAAIAAAAAAAGAAGGGIVWFPQGTYLVNTAQNSPPSTRQLLYFNGATYDEVSFVGVGPNSILKTTHATAGILELRGSARNTVRDLAFLGAAVGGVLGSNRNSNADISGAGIRLTNVDGGTVSDCHLSQFGYSAIYLTGGSKDCLIADNHVYDCTVNGWSNGINEDTLAGTSGGGTANNRGNIIRGNRIRNCSGSGGIVVDNANLMTQTKVIGNTVDTNTNFQGIRLRDAGDTIVSGNTVRNCAREGIYYELTGGTVTLDMVVTGNVVVGNTYGGILFTTTVGGGSQLRNIVIADNIVYGNGRDGIKLTAMAVGQFRDLVLIGNIVDTNDTTTPGTYDGISVLVSNASCVGNRIVGHTTNHRYGFNIETNANNVSWVGSIEGSVTADTNDPNGVLNSFLDLPNGVARFRGGVGLKVNAGAFSDGTVSFAVSGMTGVDTTNGRFWARVGSTWKSVGLDAEPKHVHVNMMATPVASVGTWVIASNAGARWFGGEQANAGAAAQNDYLEYDVLLGAGTWTMDLYHNTATSRGIYTVTIDGVSAGTIDGYAASGTNARSSITAIAVTVSGVKRVRLQMATKNASSSNYVGNVSAMTWTRTA